MRLWTRSLACAMALAIIMSACMAEAFAADIPIVPLSPQQPARGMSAADALAFLELSEGSFITASSQEEAPVASDSIVGTGMVIHYSGGSTAYCAVRGDVTGTGKLTLSQVVRLASAVMHIEPLEGPYKAAGDLNEDGQITLSDLVAEAKLYVRSALVSLLPTSPAAPDSDIAAARDEIVSYAQSFNGRVSTSTWSMTGAQGIADILAKGNLPIEESIAYEAQYFGTSILSKLDIPQEVQNGTLADTVAAAKSDITEHWAQSLRELPQDADAEIGVGLAFSTDTETWRCVLLLISR